VLVVPPPLPTFSSHAFADRKSEGALRLLSIGRLVERKGFDTVISALRLMPGATLSIAGDGPDRLRLEQLASESGFSDRISFLGRVDDAMKESLYLSHDVFVLPTREIGADKEGFGIVYLEAQYFGLPVVGGEGIGVTEALHEKLQPFALRHTPETLANAVQTVAKTAPTTKLLRAFTDRFDPKTQSQRFWKWIKSI
jgi:phosphatidylinositol alpha-1,6-mannosyltransferase